MLTKSTCAGYGEGVSEKMGWISLSGIKEPRWAVLIVEGGYGM
jgi:hypothetical protein